MKKFIAIFAVCLLLVVRGNLVFADRVDDLTAQLKSSKDYKVRLSAALALAKIRDPRSIPAYIGALRDPDKTVRGVAAASLAKVVDASVDKKRRIQVLAALKQTMENDRNSFVREQAKKTFGILEKIRASPVGKVYIDVGAMSAKGDESVRALMKKETANALSSSISSARVGGKPPSKKQLKSMSAFHVDGSLVSLTTNKQSGATLVTCKVSMLIATYPAKSMFGFLKGGASVQASFSERDIQLAKEDCVAAVVEDLVKKRIVPTIQSRAN